MHIHHSHEYYGAIGGVDSVFLVVIFTLWSGVEGSWAV